MKPYIPSIEVRNVRTGFFEESEFKAVLANLPEDLQPVAEFAYLTGWRKQEILRLQWRQISFEAGTVRLEPGSTKNDEGRTFPFNSYPALKALLERQKAKTDALQQASEIIVPWVFHRNGKPIRDYRKAWKDACKDAGVPGRIPHDFRRTAVRNLERAGVPRSVAMKLTGHKTESVYRRYAIVSEADLSEGVAKLAALQESDKNSSATSRVVVFPEKGLDKVRTK
jgi:integrase